MWRQDLIFPYPKPGILFRLMRWVCVGAPLVVVVARSWPLRTILLALVGLFVAGNLLMALSADYWMGLCARFVSGLPHGGLFRSRFDCCQPFGGEREKHFCCSYYDNGDDDCQFVRCPGREFPGALSVLAFGFCDCSVVGRHNDLVYPEVGSCFARPAGDESERAVSFLRRPEPWMLIAATMLGKRGGAFCWYSYVNPLMTEVSGFSVGTMPVLMLLAGASMCVGNYLGGHLSDRFTPGIVAMSMQFLMFASLLLIYFFASYGFLSALLMCVCTGCLFAVSSPQQLLLLQYSPWRRDDGRGDGPACFLIWGMPWGLILEDCRSNMGQGWKVRH